MSTPTRYAGIALTLIAIAILVVIVVRLVDLYLWDVTP